MRGPKLMVGYRRPILRWSGDSSRLYFGWRQTGEDEDVDLGGRARRRPAAQTTDEQRRHRAAGQQPLGPAHRRVLFVDRGDIVLLDTVAGTRRQITRTTGKGGEPALGPGESPIAPSPATTTCSWSARRRGLEISTADRRETARSATRARHRQPRSSRPRSRSSDQAHRGSRPEGEEAEEKDKGDSLPKLGLADRQSANDLLTCRRTANTSSSSSSSAPKRQKRPATCRTTSLNPATRRTSPGGPSSATSRGRPHLAVRALRRAGAGRKTRDGPGSKEHGHRRIQGARSQGDGGLGCPDAD